MRADPKQEDVEVAWSVECRTSPFASGWTAEGVREGGRKVGKGGKGRGGGDKEEGGVKGRKMGRGRREHFFGLEPRCAPISLYQICNWERSQRRILLKSGYRRAEPPLLEVVCRWQRCSSRQMSHENAIYTAIVICEIVGLVCIMPIRLPIWRGRKRWFRVRGRGEKGRETTRKGRGSVVTKELQSVKSK